MRYRNRGNSGYRKKAGKNYGNPGQYKGGSHRYGSNHAGRKKARHGSCPYPDRRNAGSETLDSLFPGLAGLIGGITGGQPVICLDIRELDPEDGPAGGEEKKAVHGDRNDNLREAAAGDEKAGAAAEHPEMSAEKDPGSGKTSEKEHEKGDADPGEEFEKAISGMLSDMESMKGMLYGAKQMGALEHNGYVPRRQADAVLKSYCDLAKDMVTKWRKYWDAPI